MVMVKHTSEVKQSVNVVGSPKRRFLSWKKSGFVILLIIAMATGGVFIWRHDHQKPKAQVMKSIDGVPMGKVNTDSHLGTPQFVVKTLQ